MTPADAITTVRARLARRLEIRTVTATERPPPGRWCVLLDTAPGSVTPARIVYANKSQDDWIEARWNAQWSIHDGDRYLELPLDNGHE